MTRSAGVRKPPYPRRKFRFNATGVALLAIGLLGLVALHDKAVAGQSAKASESHIPVRFTDIREAAGIKMCIRDRPTTARLSQCDEGAWPFAGLPLARNEKQS